MRGGRQIRPGRLTQGPPLCLRLRTADGQAISSLNAAERFRLALNASLFLGSSLLWSMEVPPLLFGVSVFGAAGYGLALFLG